MTIQWVGANTNNFEQGRRGNNPSLIVIHWIVGRLAAADATFQDPNRVASAHYGVGNTAIHQYVKEQDTAYHAGNFQINLESIGIEHEGAPDIPISEATYQTSAQLIADICRRYNIPIDTTHIRPHHDFKATTCPGNFDINKVINLAKGQTPPPINPPQGGGADVDINNPNDINAWKVVTGVFGSKAPDLVSDTEANQTKISAGQLTPRGWLGQALDARYLEYKKDAYNKGFTDGKAQAGSGNTAGTSDTPQTPAGGSGQDTPSTPIQNSDGLLGLATNISSLFQKFVDWLKTQKL